MENWQIEHCTEMPLELDFESSPGFILERRNIEAVSVTDPETGEIHVEYRCEMRFSTVKEFTKNVKVLQDTVDALIVSTLGV